MGSDIAIRPFADGDGPRVRELFIAVNRALAPPRLRDAFEAYIARSLREEIDAIADYYIDKQGGFWVATEAGAIVGMFGLEAVSHDAMQLRRMYVDASMRRRGIGRRVLQFAEDECRRRQRPRLVLSTSELQGEALALYKSCGYRLVREEIAEAASNKTLGGGIRRYHFEKAL
jgi:GNAT superfamily N-acetyltransferase